ncbi:hypothetical protein DPMN_011495 [Dreissena polymorpha]|uniref:Complex III subunit 9 n=1 Tax=Dreissena polymorpha TaxID=45954 RepID=A0A9D4N0P1_DREPO|nr:hypothetical protein DPMN_011495 [Dreissena polymorpha]
MNLQGLRKTLYKGIFQRTSTFVLACVVSAFAFERLVDVTGDQLFLFINTGKMYKDVEKKYAALAAGSEGEEEE